MARHETNLNTFDWPHMNTKYVVVLWAPRTS